MEMNLVMGINQKKMPEQDLPPRIEIKWAFDISDYDTSLDVTVPAEVENRFGITDK